MKVIIFYIFIEIASTEKKIFLCREQILSLKKDGKTIIQESIGEEFDYDPSEGQNWN